MASRLRKAGIGLTAAGGLAIALVGGWEGLKLASYRDVIGVWTACYGETRGIKPGMRFTKAQCDTMLIDGLEDFEAGMRACLARPDAIPEKPYVAFLSLAYNVGVGTFCRSSVAKKANTGDLRGACDALMLYVNAGGRRIQGLVNRRTAERKLCLEGVR
ncbi:lysozyme [Ancylobacter moscoviensis]